MPTKSKRRAFSPKKKKKNCKTLWFYRTNLFGFYRASPKKSPTSILNKYPKAQSKPILKKKKTKQKNQQQPKPNTNTRPPQSSNGKAKAKPKIRNPKEKNLINDNALCLRLKPHHQAHRCDAAMTPSLETRAIKLGSSIRDRSNWIKACDIDWERERESSVYVTPIGLELATPQGILHFTSLSFSLLIFGFCCGVWAVLFGDRDLSFFLNWFSLFQSL